MCMCHKEIKHRQAGVEETSLEALCSGGRRASFHTLPTAPALPGIRKIIPFLNLSFSCLLSESYNNNSLKRVVVNTKWDQWDIRDENMLFVNYKALYKRHYYYSYSLLGGPVSERSRKMSWGRESNFWRWGPGWSISAAWCLFSSLGMSPVKNVTRPAWAASFFFRACSPIHLLKKSPKEDNDIISFNSKEEDRCVDIHSSSIPFSFLGVNDDQIGLTGIKVIWDTHSCWTAKKLLGWCPKAVCMSRVVLPIHLYNK